MSTTATKGHHQHEARYSHCRPVRHHGRFAALGPRAILLLRSHGTELVAAGDRRVESFQLRDGKAATECHPLWSAELPAAAFALADSGLGPLVAWNTKGQANLGLFRAGQLSVLTNVSGTVTGLTSSRSEAFLALCTPDHVARLLRIDVARGAVLAQQQLANAAVDLQVDPGGSWVTVTDRTAGTVCTVPASLARPVQAALHQANRQAAAQGDAARAHGDVCSCERRLPICDCCSKGNACNGGTGCTGGTGGTGTGGTGNTGGATGGTGGNDGGCQQGSAGAPTGGGGTVVGQGGSVGKNGPGGGVGSCWLDLLWPVNRLIPTGDYVIAVDRAQRNVAVIHVDPFRVVEERQFGRGGATIAVDREAPVMLTRSSEQAGGVMEITRLDLADQNVNELTRLVPILQPLDSGVFYGGLQTDSLIDGHASPTGPINMLIFPIIEGNQTFGDPDVSKFAAYLDRVMEPHVHDYYVENSYGTLNNIAFSVFGRDIGPEGPPIKLPRTFLTDYFYPPYVPATLTLTRTGIPAGSNIVFDGRESLQVLVQPDGMLAPATLTVPFAALAFSRQEDLYPVEVKFDPADTLTLDVTTPGGTNLSLPLAFTAATITLNNDATLAGQLTAVATYLDTVLHNAETAAGQAARLFAMPDVKILTVPGKDFGTMVITVAGATNTGPLLAVTGATGTAVGTDPIGLAGAMPGAQPPGPSLASYLNLMFAIAEKNAGFDDSTRRVDDVSVTFDGASGALTTTIPVGTSVGGPTAAVTLAGSTDLDALFTSSTTQPNSASTPDWADAVRDGGQLFADVFTAAAKLISGSGQDPKAVFAQTQGAMLIPVNTAVSSADPESVQPWEMWNVTPLNSPFIFRGYELMATIADSDDSSIQLQAVWTLDFFIQSGDTAFPATDVGKPDVAMMCHEIGHCIGFRDLYFHTGYREDLAYLGDWAIMCNHWRKPHHCGYHKQEAGWITPDRVITIPPAQPQVPSTTEALLVPIEMWDDNMPSDARAAFGASANMPVVQLIQLDLGGDEAVYDLIEARQTGALFSQQLPVTPGIIITNALQAYDDQRYAFNGNYRRECQLLNPDNILQNPGDSFDLGKAPALPAAGITVTVVDIKVVRAVSVFHVKVDRSNTDFIDLYFSSSNPYYKNPDLYVDWAGDNPSKSVTDFDQRPVGTPTDQGDDVHVPPQGTELHWLVARIRNRGGVQAEQVKLQYSMCVPPGGGDRSGNFQPMGTVTLDQVPGHDAPTYGVFEWDVPAGFGGHTCIAVEVADYKIPLGSDGSALATADVWLANNHAQKNVDHFVPLQASPYAPTEFLYSVHNDATHVEYAYLEPDGLPFGMKLTVTPHGQYVNPKTTVLFHCTLELDDSIIDAGCRSDRQFRLVTWRRDDHSSVRWGGVQFKVSPRKAVNVTLNGSWDYGNLVRLDGKVAPDPGGGTVRLWLAFSNVDPVWVPVSAGAGGAFSWQGTPPAGANALNVVARFEGNATYGPAESPMVTIQQPPPLT
ncbi:hypothetical protein [Paraburkholderia flagellata]|uniref:hypothetical protein n=1 Tax=Paraburkholderia flagellata TaxID=2883241 RepID=UPI001F25085E|nr:hypothetical protein [Paraburkholderia flagellata]